MIIKPCSQFFSRWRLRQLLGIDVTSRFSHFTVFVAVDYNHRTQTRRNENGV